MSTFKAVLRVVAAHPLYLTIYALVISLMGAFIVLTSSASASSEPAEYESYAAYVAIVDRDGSPLSQAFARHMGDLYTLVDVADEPRELQDAIATGRADCVFIVPEGFGDDLIRAARAGDDLPQIEEAYGVSTQASALSGVEAARFSTLAGSAAALDGGAGLEEVATMALSAAAERADVEVRAARREALPAVWFVCDHVLRHRVRRARVLGDVAARGRTAPGCGSAEPRRA